MSIQEANNAIIRVAESIESIADKISKKKGKPVSTRNNQIQDRRWNIRQDDRENG